MIIYYLFKLNNLNKTNKMNVNNYGFKFNEIILDETNNRVIKKAKNEHGTKKINNEIYFYKKILNLELKFNIPKLIKYENGIYHMELLKNFIPITHVIDKYNFKNYVDAILNDLNNIHKQTIYISNFTIKNDIVKEVETKIFDRYNETNWIEIPYFNSIQTVNNIKIQNINCYVLKIKNTLLNLLDKRDYYNLIHGDVHLGNILCNIETPDKLYYIDPRGYFGNTKLYGLKEYDYAKLLFGLSGYSVFDNMNFENLVIEEGNLNIQFIKNYEYVFNNCIFDKTTILLFLSIWLGNNSCFVDEKKKIVSLMIAYYYCENFLDKII